ncbi:3041_t:CDS:2, partial [Gigaspora rosea]
TLDTTREGKSVEAQCSIFFVELEEGKGCRGALVYFLIFCRTLAVNTREGKSVEAQCSISFES